LIVGGVEAKTRRTAENGYAAPPFHAIGWMKGEDMMKQDYVSLYGKNNFSVPAGHLNEMGTLPVMERVH